MTIPVRITPVLLEPGLPVRNETNTYFTFLSLTVDKARFLEISPSPTLLMEVYVDRIFCNGCGVCVDMCSMGVFHLNHRTHKAEADRQNLCVGCFKCREFCPTLAITPRWIMRVS